MNFFLKVILCVLSIFFIAVIFLATSKHSLSEEKAFLMVFGNYDHLSKSSIWKNMEFPGKKEDVEEFFWGKRMGIVKSVFFQPYNENGKMKVFLLTKTIPTDIPFDCHACLPLIGATTFVFDRGGWAVESQNLFLMYAGEYGESLWVRLISVGKNTSGLLVKFNHLEGDFYKEMALIVPYKKNIVNAHQETVYHENFNDCGQSVPCTAFTAKYYFNNAKADDFYELRVRRFGTENDKIKNDRAVQIDENVMYRFVNGKYVEVARNGFSEIHHD